MRKGFTILELLVASLLLGMLVTILSMIFNQSSIAWRTGTAGITELDNNRESIAEVREQADNFFFYGNKRCRIVSPWNSNGGLRSRAYVEGGDTDNPIDKIQGNQEQLIRKGGTETYSPGQAEGGKNYLIGITSNGPDGIYDTWDDITTLPDLIEVSKP